MSNIIDKIIKEFDGVLIDEYGWEHYTVNGKDYDIRFDRSRLEWSCDCKAFTFRHRFGKKYCKHILEVQDKRWAQRIGRASARVV